MEDIKTRSDLVSLLRGFYGKAINDEVIGDKFTGINIEEHIETIADFWDSILFGSAVYSGDPFGKHLKLNLKSIDFDKWLELFTETLTSAYSGPNTTVIIERAKSIATIFKYKLNLS